MCVASTNCAAVGISPVSYQEAGLLPGAILGSNQSSVPLSVFFDSTYFANGSPISAQMTVTDSGGLTYTVPLSGPACNNLLAIANQTSSWQDYYSHRNVAESAVIGDTSNGQPYPGVTTQSAPNNIGAQWFDSLHKVVTATNPQTHPFADIIPASNWTVLFAATHADNVTSRTLGDCYSTPLTDPAVTYLSDTDIQAAVAAKAVGANPQPFLFVFMHGCESGTTYNLASDFGIPFSSTDDRGFVGYDAHISVSQQNTNFAVQAWHYLMQGTPLAKAVSDAAKLFPVQAWIDGNTPPDKSGYANPVPLGDPKMTLSGKVYNWTSGPTWYK